MKIMVFNGGPRKDGSTAALLESACDGARSAGAEISFFHLYDLDFKGCVSCFACKRKTNLRHGACSHGDALRPILRSVHEQADALLFGSPIYFASITGEMRCFLERLIYPWLAYDKAQSSFFPRKIPTGFIYAMNLDEQQMKLRGYDQNMDIHEGYLSRIFGDCRRLCCFDSYQFDYAKMAAERFDPEKKARRRRDYFPQDLEDAFKLGEALARQAMAGGAGQGEEPVSQTPS